MKKSIAKFALSAAVASALTGCTDNGLTDSRSRSDAVIVADLEATEESRTAVDPSTYQSNEVGILWTPADSVGVFGKNGTANALFTNDEQSRRVRSTTFSGSLRDGEQALYAYYPYSASAGTDPAALRGSLPGVQPFNMTTGAIVGDYKYGSPTAARNNAFTFRHLFALLRINIDASDTELADECLEEIQISAAGSQLFGDFTFSAINGSYTLDANTANSTIRMPWTDRPMLGSTSYTGFITCAPTLRPGAKLDIAVVTEGHRATFTMDVVAAMEPNRVYTLPLKLSLKKDSWTLSERPGITSITLTVAANPGKILDKEVYWNNGKIAVRNAADITLEKQAGNTFYAYIPYLNSRRLVPTYTVPEGVKVYSGDTEVVSGETEVDFLANPTLRAVAPTGDELAFEVKLENTGLPVVVIEQDPATKYTSEVTEKSGTTTYTNKFVDLYTRPKDTDFVEGDNITVYNADGSVSVEAKGGVRLRGNTTRKLDKKAFAIKFAKKQSVLGMKKHKRWCLLANRLDRSMLRNDAAFAVAHQIQNALGDGIAWTPNGVNVELVFDGRYVGNYYLCEQIKIDGSRVDINDAYEDVLKDTGSATFEQCGYLMELDQNYDENCKFKTSKLSLPVMFKDDMPSDYVSRMQSIFNAIETNLSNGNYTEAYKQLDINSMIDQMLVFEITMNDEYKHPKSVYFTYNPSGGANPGDDKIHAGAVWDFDWGSFPTLANTGSSNGVDVAYNKFNYSKAGGREWSLTGTYTYRYLWIPLLVKDKTTFVPALKTRWAKIYSLKGAISAYIYQQGQLNARSFEVNDAMWPAATARERLRNGDETLAGYDKVIQAMVTAFETRMDNLNTLINNL